MKTLLMLTLITTALCVNGQHLPYGLREAKVQKELKSKTKDIDSLVLVDKASYWNEDMKMFGLAFEGNNIYKLSVTFQSGKSSFYDMKASDVKKNRITDKSVIELIRKMNIFSVESLNTDSLNHKPSWDISDQNEWTVFLMRGKEMTIKQSYAPEVYQPILPTRDRKLFMDLFDQIRTLNN